MKLINIFLVLICFISMIGSASAITYVNGTVEESIYGDKSISQGVGAYNVITFSDTSTTVLDWKVTDIGKVGTPHIMKYTNTEANLNESWGDIPVNVGGSFYIGPAGVNGTGSFTLHKTSTSGVVDVYFIFDENYNCAVGTHDITVYTSRIHEFYVSIGSSSADSNRVDLHIDEFGCVVTGAGFLLIARDPSESGQAIFYNFGEFKNDYSLSFDFSLGEATINRNLADAELKSSAFVIRDSDGNETYNSGYVSTNNTYNYLNESAYYYIKANANEVEYLIYSNIGYVPDFESVGTIELNQTSYTDPEVIQIDAELTTYDFDNHNYYIVAEMSEDTSTWSLLLGDANDTFVISNVTESRTLDIADEYYEYPIWIKAVLRDYNKVTGVYSDIAESNEVLYNPPIAYDYTLSGTVIDAGIGTPIEGATVSAVGPITTSDTTSSAGRFTLYLAGGSYTITGSKSGYVSNVNEDIVIACNISLYGIYLTQTSYTNGTMNGIIKDADTGESLQDVHLIFTNATDRIDAYSSVGGYYTSSGFEQSTSYDIRAIKSGYYSYNGSVTIAASGGTHKSFDMIQINYSVTPTATVLDTYPDGEGHAWTNDEIVTMLRIVVPGVFMMMFIFLLLAVLMGVGGNNGGNGGQGMGMKELWQR